MTTDEVAGPRRRGPTARATARYEQTRRRLEQTTAGHVTRRAVEVDVVHQALVFAALGFMLVVPILISVAALVPLGAAGGTAVGFAHRLGLTAEATRDLQALFPVPATVHGSSTWGGVLLSIVCAFSWPATLQKGYERVWELPRAGVRELWRPAVWLVSVVVLISVAALLGGVSSGMGRVVIVVVGLPALLGWTWWTQRFLLCARIAWRRLLPGAVTITVGLAGLAVLATFLLSASIVAHHDRYGPIGVVFILLSWLVAASVVFLGGALVGKELGERFRGEVAGTGARGEGGGTP